MKIYQMIPGSRIKENEEKIMKEILHQINPDGLDSVDNFRRWQRINSSVYNLEQFLNADSLLVMYIHPVCSYINRVFDTKREELVTFMRKHINEEESSGVDMIVCAKDFSVIIVCNHDGEIYLVS